MISKTDCDICKMLGKIYCEFENKDRHSYGILHPQITNNILR
jgi:hypothetical protein